MSDAPGIVCCGHTHEQGLRVAELHLKSADYLCACTTEQLANMTASAREARDGNLTSASLAAVAMATTAVDAALLNVEQAVGKAGQNKQVGHSARARLGGRFCRPAPRRDICL